MFIISRPRVMHQPGRRNMRGVSLLEVLISILLSAIGLLALAGANVAAIRYSKMSQYRGTATALAADLAERMRANKAGLANYSYVATDFSGQAFAIAADTSCETYTPTACSPSSLATYDLNTWRRVVRSQLPEGSVFIAIQAAQSAADVWLAWKDPAVADADANSTDSRNAVGECPNGLNVDLDKSIRCSFFRINL